MVIQDLRTRIQRRLTEMGIGPVEATNGIDGLGRDYIRDFLEGKKESFSQAKMHLVAVALKWTLAELMPETQAKPASKVGSAKLTPVRLIDWVAAGRLAEPGSQIPVEDVPLLAFADLGRGDFFALKVRGNSMDRISPDGSTIIVNRSEKALITGKCYVFSVKGETTYKRWPGGKQLYLASYSTDPAEGPVFIDNKKDLEVVGRVRRTLLDL